MTVGETLTEARYQAGLSVDELSERTRIRGTVIRSIEQDDYEACGGDLYVRGYVRAIAGAVGIDAQPLIREFDLGRVAEGSERANGSTGRHARGLPAATTADAAPTSFDLTPVAAELPPAAAPTAFDLTPVAAELPPAAAPDPVPGTAGPGATRFDLPVITDDLMDAGYDLGPAPGPGAAGPAAAGTGTSTLPAAGADPDAVPLAGDRPPRTGGGRPGRNTYLGAAVIGLVLLAAGFLGFRLVTGGTSTRNTAATAPATPDAQASAAASAAARASASAQASASAKASAAAQARQSAAAKSAAQRAAAQRVTTLPVASVMAIGPDGFADGDNPGSASAAIARHATAPWSTQWYTTPQFGMLKHGTGLLLSLGHTVTVTSVRLDLSPYQGATLQLRAGNGTVPQDLGVAATANNASGALRLTLRHPVTAKYLLIWFTQLPPDGAGHYAETVSGVVVTGHR